MQKLDKLIAVVVVTGILLLLFSVGFDFISGRLIFSNSKPILFELKEPFEAPTRAADCRCLPGYIPSKQGPQDKVVFIKEYGVYGYITSQKVFYDMRQNCNQCGQNFCARAEDMKLADLSIKLNKTKEIKYGGFFSCAVAKPSPPSNTYFCQSLTNGNEFKMCY